ncbi:hypothetical protein F8S13_27180 [Chloroflexia bacterium SDU3-3]|nr:hypothetical protein F8S13_27180 [Chloroflexia bacterium SDU3-3]
MSQQESTSQHGRQNIQASTWAVLLIFFAGFCVLIATVGFWGWRFYADATDPELGSVALKYVDTGVLIQQPDRTVPQEMTEATGRPAGCPTDTKVCMFFSEGQHLIGRRGAGYGPVAALKLPDSSLINLHTQPAGFDLALRRYRVSRWTKDRQDVVVEQLAGYARYDLANNQPYKNVTFAVLVGNAKLSLALGGSYSIDVPRSESGEPRGRLVTDAPISFEISVRRGTALIESHGQSLSLRPGDKVQVAVDGSFVEQNGSPFQAAQWELIADGDFSQFTTPDYNTPGKSTTWNIRSYAPTPVYPGDFSVVQTCPPEKPFCSGHEQIRYGQFHREAGDGKPFYTGIDNPVDIDVSEYTSSLVFHLEASIIKQSVKNTGERGTDCPIFVEITYKQKSPTDSDQFYRMCVFAAEDDEIVRDATSRIDYRQISRFGTYPIEVDLRTLDQPLRDAWYISNVRIEARGHDYISQVTRVSLIGKMR